MVRKTATVSNFCQRGQMADRYGVFGNEDDFRLVAIGNKN